MILNGYYIFINSEYSKTSDSDLVYSIHIKKLKSHIITIHLKY